MGDLTKEGQIEPVPGKRLRTPFAVARPVGCWLATLGIAISAAGVPDRNGVTVELMQQRGEVHMLPQVRRQAMAPGNGEPASIGASPCAGQSIALPSPRSLLLDQPGPPSPARILAMPEGRGHGGAGQLAYAIGLPRDTATDTGADTASAHRRWDAFDPPEPVRSPVHGAVVGYQAHYLGTLQLVDGPAVPGGVGTLAVVHAAREIGAGAWLQQRADDGVDGILSRDRRTGPAPATPATMEVRVAAMPDGRRMAGAGQVVVLDAGAAAGLVPGACLLLRHAATASTASVVLPERDVGRLIVLRVSSALAYAGVTEAIDAIRIGDRAISPRPSGS